MKACDLTVVQCYKTKLLFYISSCGRTIQQPCSPSNLNVKHVHVEHQGSVLYFFWQGRVLELKLKALVLDTIHHISVVEGLAEAKVTSVDDWEWKKQLRFYLDPEGSCLVSMVDATFRYTYEYQGNTAKLVHTPLTDKCYLTLTQGMKVGLGGNPYGPAGK